MSTIHWIETELSRHIQNLDITKGADLDRNGKIEESERTDLNGDGDVDVAEWQKFLDENKAAIKRLGGHFNYYYSAGNTFRPDNPIHDLLSIESEIVSRAEVMKAYDKVEKILGIVRKDLPRVLAPGKKLKKLELAQKKLKLVYDAMMQVGIKYGKQNDPSFVRNINNEVCDCDTRSFVLLAVAHELGWPVDLVNVPGHMFVRWDDGSGIRFNMDYSNNSGGINSGIRIRTDILYASKLNISQKAINQGVYMKNLSYRETISVFYNNRGLAKHDLGRYQEAISDYDRAIEFNPNYAYAYDNNGLAKHRMGRYQEAISDYDKAIELEPNYANAYNNRGLAKHSQGRYQEAISDYDKAIELDPNHAIAYNNRGFAKHSQGRYQEAISDYNWAIELDPNYVNPYNNRKLAEHDASLALDKLRSSLPPSGGDYSVNAVGAGSWGSLTAWIKSVWMYLFD